MCAAAILSLASLIGAPTPPAAWPESRLTDLVRQLGDKSYRTRENAAHELLRHGSAAVSVLTEGVKDSDPEVSERCRQLLPQAASLERTEKLAAFLKDLKAPPPKGLPGVEKFLKITGDTKTGRELYAEMLAIHHVALEAAEDNPRKATEYYQQFCDEAFQRYQSGARTGRYSYDNLFTSRADITFFFVISGDPRLRKNTPGINRAYILLYGNQVQKAITDGETAETMRKLFLDWLGGDLDINLQQRAFMLAAQANMKEAVPVILKMLDKPGQQTYVKAQVMIALAKLGTKEHLPKLEPYLSDKTVIGNINFGNGLMQIQVRDVALGVSVLMTEQKLADYGFDTRFGGTPTQYYYFGFPDSQDGKECKAREDAHAKWKEWAEKNLSKKK
jgi:hypothetical protein